MNPAGPINFAHELNPEQLAAVQASAHGYAGTEGAKRGAMHSRAPSEVPSTVSMSETTEASSVW